MPCSYSCDFRAKLWLFGAVPVGRNQKEGREDRMLPCVCFKAEELTQEEENGGEGSLVSG